jgi:hypothetical protein
MTSPNYFHFRVSPTATASTVTASPILGDVRIEGWIKADDMKSGLEACRLVAGLFDMDHAGGFSLDGTFTDFPFSVDVRPGLVPKTIRLEDRDELLDRVLRVLKGSARRLAREREAAARNLEARAFNYAART